MKPWKYFLHRSRQSGDILIAFAVLIPLLCALGGLTLDVGNVYVTRSRLQNATDSAVIAGAYQIGNSERVDQTVQEYLYSNTRQAYDSVIYGEKAPEAERTASYTIDASKQNELDVTMYAKVPFSFLRFFGFKSYDVSATSKARIGQQGLTDEMFKYSLVAAHKSSSDYDFNNWQSRQQDYGLWFDAEGMEIEGDIMTNGKIVFNQSAKSYLKGTLNVSKDGASAGKSFSQSFWRNNVQVTKDYDPTVWGAYGWNNGQMEWYTLVDENGDPLTKEIKKSNGHFTDVNTDKVVVQDKNIDISVEHNSSIKALLDSYKSMSVKDREAQHIYYDDNRNNGSYNFSSSHTRVYPALTSNDTGRIVSSKDTDIPVWNRYYTTIVVPNDIQVSFENSPEPGSDDFAIIVSLYGNIHIPNGVTFRGILYAPNGTVRIDGTAKIDGNVIAQQILMSTPGQSVRGKNYVRHTTTGYKGTPVVTLIS